MKAMDRIPFGRRRRSLGALAGALLLAMGGAANLAEAAAETFVLRIGTGSSVGVYRAAGDAICRLLDGVDGIDCRSQFSTGSFDNIQSLRANRLEMAIVQSDVQYQAFSSNPDDLIRVGFGDLRHVASLMDEPLTLIATTRSGISAGSQMAGRRVFLGEPGSGTEFLIAMIEAIGPAPSAFEQVRDLRTNEAADALCRHRIDAAAFVSGQPNILARDATRRCAVTIVPVTSERALALAASQKFYAEMVIPAGLYRNTPSDVPTIGVRATLVTRADVPDAVVGAVTKAIYEGIAEFRRLHLAFAKFSPSTLAAACNSAPLHAATADYLAQRGITQDRC